MFFIKSGRIAVVLAKHNNFKFLKIKAGYYFGELDLLFYNEIRKYTTVALKDCELLTLNKSNFKSVFLGEFREIGMEFVKNAYFRKQRTRKAYKEAIKYFLKTKGKEWECSPSNRNKISLSPITNNIVNLFSFI